MKLKRKKGKVNTLGVGKREEGKAWSGPREWAPGKEGAKVRACSDGESVLFNDF